MLCQECRLKEANIHIVKNINGTHSELNLCEHCARKKEELDFSFEPQFSLHKLFNSMLNQSICGSRETMQADKIQCPSCRLTFSQFSQIGRLGCSRCIPAFEEKIEPLLRRIHGSSTHTGKIPVKVRKRVNKLREIDQLKEDLKAKIQNEEFEKAALLRDRIKTAEKEIKRETDQEDGKEDDCNES